jgi:hypothetical protein
VQNNRVRVLAERIPHNGGGAVQGPVTVQDTVVTLSGNATTVNLPHNNADDAFTITLLPPGESTPSAHHATDFAATGRLCRVGAVELLDRRLRRHRPGGRRLDAAQRLASHGRAPVRCVGQQHLGRQRPRRSAASRFPQDARSRSSSTGVYEKIL